MCLTHYFTELQFYHGEWPQNNMYGGQSRFSSSNSPNNLASCLTSRGKKILTFFCGSRTLLVGGMLTTTLQRGTLCDHICTLFYMTTSMEACVRTHNTQLANLLPLCLPVKIPFCLNRHLCILPERFAKKDLNLVIVCRKDVTS